MNQILIENENFLITVYRAFEGAYCITVAKKYGVATFSFDLNFPYDNLFSYCLAPKDIWENFFHGVENRFPFSYADIVNILFDIRETIRYWECE